MAFRKIAACAAALIIGATASFARTPGLSNLSEIKDVTYVYVPQLALMVGGNFMNKSIGDNSAIDSEKMDFRKLKSIEIVNADGKKPAAQVREACKAILNGIDKELLLTTRENDQETSIYVGSLLSDDKARDMYIINSEPDEYNLIVIKGVIPLSLMKNNSDCDPDSDSDSD